MNRDMNEVQKSITDRFAKENKYSRAKLAEFVGELFQAFPKSAHKGRQPSEKTLQLEAKLAEASTINTGTFTLKQLALTLGADAPSVTNCMKKLEQSGKAFLVGTAVKQSGVRGKTPMLWSFQALVNTPVEPSHE